MFRHRSDWYTDRCAICGEIAQSYAERVRWPWSWINALYHLLFWWAPARPTVIVTEMIHTTMRPLREPMVETPEIYICNMDRPSHEVRNMGEPYRDD